MAKVNFQQGTQAQYDALKTAGQLDPNTFYLTTDAQDNYAGTYLGDLRLDNSDICHVGTGEESETLIFS